MFASSPQCVVSISPRARAACASALALVLCATATQTFGQACTTSITGKVYSPNGPTTGDPIPNILVYVPLAAYPVPTFPQGVGGGCSAQTNLVPAQVMVSSTTAFDGTFTLTNPALTTAGNVTVVIQAGKWRRQYTNISVPACQTTSLPNLTMPASTADGDLPEIAIVSGGADALECVFRKIGIKDSEFNAAGGTGHISLYQGSGTPGITLDAAGTALPNETTMMSSSPVLSSYDLAMFSCQGTATNAINSTSPAALTEQANLVNYANSGGRVFATHYSYVYLDEPGTFAAEANWLGGTANRVPSPTGNGVATIDTSYPEGLLLSKWLSYVGATNAATPTQLPLTSVKQDQTGVIAPTQSWATLNPPYSNTAVGTPIMQFTFDTPVNATTTPVVSLSYVNNPAQFLQGDPADTIQINVSNGSSTTPADRSLNLSLTLPAGVTPVSLQGVSASTGWACSVATLVCNRTSPLAAGATDAVLLTLGVSPSAPLGLATVNGAIAGGGLSGTNQCGRVLFNEYHVEAPTGTSKQFPNECDTLALTPQEKFLEFSLYNLSNFVAPVTNDTIDIVAYTSVTWATPAPVFYGTPLSSTQLDATASAPGTFVYTPPAGTTTLPVGPNTLSVVFTPTDPTSYIGAKGSTTLTVLQDTTTTTLTSTPNPSTLGQPATFTATVIGNAAPPTGTVSFFAGGVPLGTGTLAAATGDTSTATFSTSALPIGNNNITAVYTATTNFGGSGSTTLVQVVKGVSSVVITGLVTPIDYGQIIGATALETVTGSSTGGTSTVYIDGVSVCVLAVAPGLTNTCPPSTGAGYQVGMHSIYAVFSGDALYNGSTSTTYAVQIVPDPTTITLNSSLNPSRLGNSVTFTATVAAPYATPAGLVTFFDGTKNLGIGTLSPQGALQSTALYSTTALAIGSHNITATYAATTDFSASAANSLGQLVLPPLPLNGEPGYILTVTPSNLNAFVGANNEIDVNINEVNGYSEPVTITCGNLPVETTCGFTQATVPAGGGTIILYLTPGAPHACGATTPYFVASSRTNSLIWMSGLGLCLFFVRRRRRLLKALTLVLALCVLPILNGCGTGCTDFGTKPGVYSFTVTATPTATPAITNDPYLGPQTQTVTFNAVL